MHAKKSMAIIGSLHYNKSVSAIIAKYYKFDLDEDLNWGLYWS